jgi:hypothetical protein
MAGIRHVNTLFCGIDGLLSDYTGTGGEPVRRERRRIVVLPFMSHFAAVPIIAQLSIWAHCMLSGPP